MKRAHAGVLLTLATMTTVFAGCAEAPSHRDLADANTAAERVRAPLAVRPVLVVR